jgi:hypothetical protein
LAVDAQRLRSINDFLQGRLRERGLPEVTAVQAATWLDVAGLLGDNDKRPGSPLRKLLRADLIAGAEQRPPQQHGKWFIVRA